MNSNQIRAQFLSFFQSKNHEIVPSAPLVLKDDPTLMFVNSGMVQFKDYFLGIKKPSNPKIADSQKCLRVSGKHNDLDDVGKDTYHHTLFEMLGNWSIGDYFKEEAIAWSWELLTEVFQIPKENIYVTIFEGDVSEKLEKDAEAYSIWKKYIAEDRILLGNKKDNFWEMGEQGPCGPCSEIHVDIRSAEEKKQVSGQDLVNKDHPLVIEIWNLVFMQYQRMADGSLIRLSENHVDTGMGFERLTMVLQGKTSNYDTDIFQPLIQKIEKITGFTYGKEEYSDIAIRVIADHLRAVSFAIADGQLPSNNGAGYVIRRILRRAISYGYRFLNAQNPFIFELVEVLSNQMGEAYPELKHQYILIKDVIKEEEANFLHTIENGLQRLNSLLNQNNTSKIIDGKVIYELKDTYGFPPDLSRIIVEEKGFSIDEKGYEEEEKRLKDLSRQLNQSKTSDWVVLQPEFKGEFMGHEVVEAPVSIARYRKVESPKGNYFQLVFNQSPFYPEGGGQVGDSGILSNGEENIIITDTKKETGLIYSITDKLPNDVQAEFLAKVDRKKRISTTQNHSATHLLHESLREVLGTHVEQKGSYVGEEELRFDFSHYAKMSPEELQKVENQVNEKIKKSIPLQEFNDISMQEALDKGAMALFGEKYGDTVRMIQFGNSKELCGGSHVANTSDIQHFKLLNEGSVASGVRRIKAITGEKAWEYYKDIEKQWNQVQELLQYPQNTVEYLEKQQQEISDLKKQLEMFQKQEAKTEKEQWKKASKNIHGKEFIGVHSQLPPSLIKDLVYQLKSEIPQSVIVVTSENEGKPFITIGLSDDITHLNAGQMVRELAQEIEGGGGGQPTFATAGGKNINGLKNVLSKAQTLL